MGRKLPGHKLQHIIGREKIVCVQNADHIARGRPHALVHAVVDAVVFAGNELHGADAAPVVRSVVFLLILPAYRRRIVLTHRIFDNVLYVGVTLTQHTFQRILDGLPVVLRRGYYAYFHRVQMWILYIAAR